MTAARRNVWWVFAAVLAIAVLVVLASSYVGNIGPSKSFNWTLASVFGTALGTTLLALGTGVLAYLTWSEVGATQQLAELTKRDQDERERPLLVQFDARFNGSADSGRLDVVLFNAGLGPALRVELTATYTDERYPLVLHHTYPAVRAEGTAEITIPVNFGGNPLQGGVRGDGFALSGTYWDRSRRNRYSIVTNWDADAGPGADDSDPGRPVSGPDDSRRARVAWQMVELNWWIIGAVMSRAAIVTAVQTAGIIVLGQRVFAGNGTLSAGTPHFLGQVSLLVLAFALLMAADVAFGFRPARGFTIRAIEPPPLLDTERFASWNEADYFSQMLYNHGAVSKRMEDSLRYAVILSGVALIVLGVALALR